MRRLSIICFGLLVLLGGCQTMPSSDSAVPSGAVYHFVAIWLKNPEDESARAAIAEKCVLWRSYPGVRSVTFGQGLPGGRSIVQDYDMGILMVFKSEAALRKYEQDPAHKEAVKTVLAPVAAKVQVYDFKVE
ncbi:MAG: Dabb family protein [Verrucomicrobiota bacterium]